MSNERFSHLKTKYDMKFIAGLSGSYSAGFSVGSGSGVSRSISLGNNSSTQKNKHEQIKEKFR